MFPGIGLDEQLLHGRLQLPVPLPGHAAGVVQAVDVERRLFEFRLVQSQRLEQHLLGGHLHGGEHPVRLQAPVLPEHVPVFLIHPGVAGPPPRALDGALDFVREQVFLQF